MLEWLAGKKEEEERERKLEWSGLVGGWLVSALWKKVHRMAEKQNRSVVACLRATSIKSVFCWVWKQTEEIVEYS